jgi:transglutaminase-like putative cysteine protease
MERILQVGVAAIVALSTVLLGMGDRNISLTIAAVIIAFSSVYITDIKGWIRLPDRLADLLGLAAGVLALFQWQRDVSDAGLLALLSFVIYGQFVLQLKQKSIPTYWLLIALSLMETAVSTALNESLLFGILLLAYVVLAIGVLTVFYLFREQSRVLERIAGTDHSATHAPAIGFVPTLRHVQPLLFTGGAQQQQAEGSLNLALFRLVCNVGVIALGLGCVVFGAIPRAERGVWREKEVETAQRVVGFANEVQLGEMGAISESAEEIMEVYLTDPVTREALELVDEPLFRGVALTTYANRKWSQELPTGGRIKARKPPQGAPIVRQRYIVQPLDTDVLFCLYPSYSPVSSGAILWSEGGEQLMRTERRQGTSIEYELTTTSIVDRRQSAIVQASQRLDRRMERRLTLLPNPRGNLKDPLAGTKAAAERIVRGIPAEDHLERARVLTNFLRDPTNFRYSLGEVQRDTELDPVEDFVTKNRVGHCEYYASALALMLRTVGIPTRLAVGFKGGDWFQDHYQVRALNAHAWVEAYLAPEYLPAQLPPEFDRERGGWLILDPTGGIGTGAIPSTSGYVIEGIKQFTASLRNVWRTYVLGLNHSRQQESLYVPMREGMIAGLVNLTDRHAWRGLARRIVRWLSPAYWGLTNGGWFSWRGAIAAMVVMLAVVGAVYAVRWTILLLRRWSVRGLPSDDHGGADVAFYRRLERLLAQRDLLRAPSQTQREFALAVGGQLAESAQTKRAAPVARQLVELFYRVRFGRRTLDSDEAAAVEQALSELADALTLAGERRAQDHR